MTVLIVVSLPVVFLPLSAYLPVIPPAHMGPCGHASRHQSPTSNRDNRLPLVFLLHIMLYFLRVCAVLHVFVLPVPVPVSCAFVIYDLCVRRGLGGRRMLDVYIYNIYILYEN